MAGTQLDTAQQGARRREARRFLLATLAITLLYLAIQETWMWGATQLAHRGWTFNDPARTFAAEAGAIAERSRPLEARLAADFPWQVFLLGYDFGYLSQWLGGYGQQSEETMRQLAQPVAVPLRRLRETAAHLGIDPPVPLPVRTAADFSGLTQRIESDVAGSAAQIERAGSPRLRHLFLFAAHVGTEAAALESPGDMAPIPATALIGMHATLAGVPEALWRPLGRVAEGSAAERQRRYMQALADLEKWLKTSAMHAEAAGEDGARR